MNCCNGAARTDTSLIRACGRKRRLHICSVHVRFDWMSVSKEAFTLPLLRRQVLTANPDVFHRTQTNAAHKHPRAYTHKVK